MISLLEKRVAKIKPVFPSYLCCGRLPGAAAVNRELKREILALEKIDDHGNTWSQKNYVNGYSSYSSFDRLQMTSPNFAELEKKLKPFMKSFVRKLRWNLGARSIEMTTCWANRMSQGSYHTMHTHPSSVISGVYYVDTPRLSSPLKLEDPRIGLFMASPARLSSAPESEQPYILLNAKAGEFILFESWMRHEVPPHRGSQDRFSVSFNYEWI